MTDNTITVASAISKTAHARDFGKAQKASAASIEGLANSLKEGGVKGGWIPTDKFKDGNLIHLETFNQIADGLLTPKRAERVKQTGKEYVATLSEADKKQRESDRRQVRRLTMVLLTQVVFVMEGGKPVEVDAKSKSAKTDWQNNEKRMGALLWVHDDASGTDKAPQTQFDIELQKRLKPVIDFLRSKSDVAERIHSGYGQQYKGSFSLSKKK